jgi:hypothetical protein
MHGLRQIEFKENIHLSQFKSAFLFESIAAQKMLQHFFRTTGLLGFP